jgi:hypothetical protein
VPRADVALDERIPHLRCALDRGPHVGQARVLDSVPSALKTSVVP